VLQRILLRPVAFSMAIHRQLIVWQGSFGDFTVVPAEV